MKYKRPNPIILVSYEKHDGTIRFEHKRECSRGHHYDVDINTGCPDCRKLSWSEKKIMSLATNAAIALSQPGLMVETAQHIAATLSVAKIAPALAVPRQRVDFEEWFRGNTVPMRERRTLASVLYDHYYDWAYDSNRTPLSKHLWGRMMAARFERTKSNVTYYLGVDIKPVS